MHPAIYFSFFPGATPVRYAKLADPHILLSPTNKMLTDSGWSQDLANNYMAWEKDAHAEMFQEILEQEMITAIAKDEERYPTPLIHLSSPPMALFIKGILPQLHIPRIAIVGTRRASPYGKQITAALARGLASAGVQVISGLAFGIDGVAHRETLTAGGYTAAVLGSGINERCIAPRNHIPLAKDIIASNGAILSEYAPGTEATPYTFPARNRIIAALSDAVVVTDAPIKSGALITAKCALSLGKDVYAIPQNINSPTASGVNHLIAEGATPINSIPEFLSYFQAQEKKPAPIFSSSEEQQLFEALSGTPQAVDAIIEQTGLSSAYVGAMLTTFVIRGFATQTSGNKYVLSGYAGH